MDLLERAIANANAKHSQRDRLYTRNTGFVLIGQPFTGNARNYDNNSLVDSIARQERKGELDELRHIAPRNKKQSFVLRYLFGINNL